MEKSKIKDFFEWIFVIALAFLCAYLINNFILTNSTIPTPSMESTLPVGSRVFGFRLNYHLFNVSRGDVVVFDYGFICPNCEQMYQKNDNNACPSCGTSSTGAEKAHYIKRVIGLPGDHIEIKADYVADSDMFKTLNFYDDVKQIPCGHVYINGELYHEDYLNEPMIVDSNMYKSIDLIVPDGCYYLLGDNRNNSEDARFWPNSFITMKDIEAKAYLVYWPLYKFGLLK